MFGLDNQVGVIILYTVYGLSLNVFIYSAYIRSIPLELRSGEMASPRPSAALYDA